MMCGLGDLVTLTLTGYARVEYCLDMQEYADEASTPKGEV